MEMPTITPARRLKARVAALLMASDARNADAQGFVSQRVSALDLTFEGIPGERHFGFTRPADARVPWYKRGSALRNVRQVSLVSAEELVEIAGLMGLPEIRPEWLGANLVIEGLPRLSFLPAGSRLFFEGGGVLAAEGYNAPCSISGTAVAAGAGLSDKLAFVKPATRRRGIVASVERPGRVEVMCEVEITVPDQWMF
jgi:hypothetical protein